MADRLGRRAQVCSDQPVAVHVQVIVQVEHARAGAAQVAGRGRQQPDRAHDVAPGRLALEPLADPEQRRAGPIDACGALDQLGGHTGHGLGSLRIAVGQERLDLLPAGRVLVQERAVEQPVAGDHVQQPEGQRGIGARERLQVEVGRRGGRRPHRIDDDHLGRCRPSQCSSTCGPDADGFAPQTTMQDESRDVRGSKPVTDVPYV